MAQKDAFDTWFDKFEPVENEIEEEAAYYGCLFQKGDEEMEFVTNADPNCVWTLFECDSQDYVVSGMEDFQGLAAMLSSNAHSPHPRSLVIVTRGYFVTNHPWREGISFRVDM